MNNAVDKSYDALARTPDDIPINDDGTVPSEENETPQQESADNAVIGVTWRDYVQVFKDYPRYRYYFLSGFCQHIGNWFVQIAGLLLVEHLSAHHGSEGKSLGSLILSVMIPKGIFAQVGGILADRFDRRNLLVSMNIASAIIALFYILAVALGSLKLVFIITGLRSAIESAQYSSVHGLIPLLVPDPRALQLAVTIQSWAWCLTAILGGMVAGAITAILGYQACYFLDSIAYFASAFFLYYGVPGSFNVTSTTHKDHEMNHAKDGISRDESTLTTSTNPVLSVMQNFYELVIYIHNCGFGMLLFLKTTATLFMAPIDIVSATFAHMQDEDGENESSSSFAMGMTFTVLGIGSWLGPTLLNFITDGNRPYTVQRACVIGLFLASGGWYLVSLSTSFGVGFLLAVLIRSIGASALWLLSTLILQTLTEKQIMGRVLALDFTLFSLVDAGVAIMYGRLYDGGASKQTLSVLAATLALLLGFVWGCYHLAQRGAAAPRFQQLHREGSERSLVVVTEGARGDEEELEMIGNVEH
mmetsp:Transcript_17554/g.47853  ORF Transcript_17554/g.47853 Transcript_17554/m.47853 type:complete len:530 (+) Transcript_17554:104-1693(+)